MSIFITYRTGAESQTAGRHAEGSVNLESTVGEPQPAAGKQPDRFGVSLAFSRKHPCCQVVGRITILDGNHFLQNDRTVVVLIVSEVHRAATDFYPPFDRRLVDMMSVESMAAERGDQ